MKVGRAAATLWTLMLATASPASAKAASPRVATVNPDPELVHALEIALLPWGVAVVPVAIDGPGATMPIAADRARSIARQNAADVLVWVSESNDRYALWIYEVASDHASTRALLDPPPFAASAAAAVALAVKSLLRATDVAPPPERFGATARSETWMVSLEAAGALHAGAAWRAEARGGVDVSLWPARFSPFGFWVGIDSGNGTPARAPPFSGTLTDTALRAGAGARVTIGKLVSFASFLGAGAHVTTLTGSLADHSHFDPVVRVDGAVESGVGLAFAFFGARLSVEPWLEATLLTRWQRYRVDGTTVLDLGPLTLRGALRVALAWP